MYRQILQSLCNSLIQCNCLYWVESCSVKSNLCVESALSVALTHCTCSVGHTVNTVEVSPHVVCMTIQQILASFVFGTYRSLIPKNAPEYKFLETTQIVHFVGCFTVFHGFHQNC